MEDSVVIAQLAASPQSRVELSEGARGQRPSPAASELTLGAVVRASVVRISGREVIIEIDGARYVISNAQGLTPGQAMTLRVAALGEQILFEVLAEATSQDKHLASALRALFGGSPDIATLFSRLASLVGDARQQGGQPLPLEILEQLNQKLAAPAVEADARALAQNLQRFIAGWGLSLEAELGKLAAEGRQETTGLDTARLRPLLASVLAQLDSALAKDQALPKALAQALENLRSALVSGFRGGSAQAATQLVQRLAADLQAVLQITQPEQAQRQAQVAADLFLERFSKLAEGAGGRRAVLLSDAQAALEVVRNELTRQVEILSLLRQFAEAASDLKARLDGQQTLNSLVGERQHFQHLIFPVHILDELAEVQIKQFLAGRKGSAKKRSLTAVMLLNLESLGRMRIDALLLGRTLYVSFFVERKDVAALVEQLGPRFSEQLEARGFRLAKLVTRTDEKKIEDFHRLSARQVTRSDSLIDLQV